MDLARQYLAAGTLPRLVRTVGGTAYSLLPTSPRPPRAAGWFLAVAGDYARWPAETRGLGVEVSTLIALERFRHDETRLLAAQQAAELVRLASADDTPPAEVASRLRVSGLAADEPVGVLVAGVDTGGIGALDGVLEEICVPFGPRSLVTTVDDEAIAILPVAIDRFDATVTAVRATAEALRPGLGTVRLSIGVAAAPASATGLRGALREARYARRLARHRTGQTSVVASDELASHSLLLATVPEELRRSFRQRLLGPLLDYDRAHQSDLVGTLGVFLDCNGSWNRSAARLHVHINTLRYRIGRIEQLTGRDLGSTVDRVDLFLALRMS